MGMFSALSSISSGTGSVLGSVATGLFNARQASKNRSFQRKMSNTAINDRDWETYPF